MTGKERKWEVQRLFPGHPEVMRLLSVHGELCWVNCKLKSEDKKVRHNSAHYLHDSKPYHLLGFQFPRV